MEIILGVFLMNSENLNNKYFHARELSADVALLESNITYLTKSNVNFLIDILSSLTQQYYNKVIIDVSKIFYIDNISIIRIINKVNEMLTQGKIARLVVNENKPNIVYSVGHPVTELNVYLTIDKALKDFLN